MRDGEISHVEISPKCSEIRIYAKAIEIFQELENVIIHRSRRWVVLTNNFIYTFKDRRVYDTPTEAIPLKEIVSIKSTEEELGQKNSFVMLK